MDGADGVGGAEDDNETDDVERAGNMDGPEDTDRDRAPNTSADAPQAAVTRGFGVSTFETDICSQRLPSSG